MVSDQPQPTYLSVKETASRLGVHENTVRNWVKEGVLRSARVPGSKFHRFDENDVERLRRDRGSVVSSVEAERRIVGPELINASQLHLWSTTRQAADLFPELIRRLLASTPGVTAISIRSGDGVSLEGWDGTADVKGAPFLPEGSLGMEFGVGDNPKGKADDDFDNRSKDPLGLDPVRTCFLFATPRRWKAGKKWAADRRQARIFADVRVIDADDLEAWLKATPAVHHWISEQLGRRPADAQTLEAWWETFRDRTDPALPAALFLAGRSREQERLKAILSGPPTATTIQSAWVEDGKAFLYAAVEGLSKDAGHTAQSPLLVRSADVWDRIIEQPGRMTLVPEFGQPNISRAQARGHHVILLADLSYAVVGDKIELPRPARRAAAEAFQAVGISSDRAYELAALARRSMPALVRMLAKDRRVARPAWTQPPQVATFAPLVLAGSFTTSEADVDVICRLVGSGWVAVERELARCRTTEDPPFIWSGNQWRLAAPEEALLLLSESLTSTDLRRWHEIAAEVLVEVDPMLEVPVGERLTASMRGTARKASPVLRRGIAQGAALLSSLEDRVLSDGETAAAHASTLVREVLKCASGDESGKVWRSLADVMPLLAEAAPNTFLDSVHDDLDRDEPLLLSMFQDAADESWMYSSSPHSHLIWAIATLCWSPEYLSDGSAALARLHLLDPGGRLANRPLNELGNILSGWIRNTSASLEQKTTAITQICKRYTEVGWPLVRALWPSRHAFSAAPASPRFHDWKPEDTRPTLPEWMDFIRRLVDLAIEVADENSARWADLCQHLTDVPTDQAERLLDHLSTLVPTFVKDSESRLRLWEALRDEAAKHERFASADWAMGAELLARFRQITDSLEPSDNMARFAYLFDWHPDLPGIDLDDHKGYPGKLEDLRRKAIKEVLVLQDGIEQLAHRAAVPRHLGSCLVGLLPVEMEAKLFTWLDSSDKSLQETAVAWAGRSLAEQGLSWLRSCLDRPEMRPQSRRDALVVLVPARREFWEELSKIDPALAETYWRGAYPIGVDPQEIGEAAEQLLKQGRAWVAIDLLAHFADLSPGAATTVTTDLAERALKSALSDPNLSHAVSASYAAGQLLDYLERQGAPAETLVHLEYPFFRLLEHQRQPRALYSALCSDPDLFTDLVKHVYRGKSEAVRQPTEHQLTLATLSWSVLRSWPGFPGRRDDGSLDSESMNQWVRQARLALSDADRADIGDEIIGESFAGSPTGEDGAWPAEPVRELIETLGSQDLATGIHIGKFNSRGVISRDPFEGGRKERLLVEQYTRWSKITAGKWPRTARILRSLAESYERDAQRQDIESELFADN